MVATKKKQTIPYARFLKSTVEKPQVFFVPDQKITTEALQTSKYFYDTAKQYEEIQFSPFTELLTEGFDNDQIWEEIATQNEPFLDYSKSTLKEFSKINKKGKRDQQKVKEVSFEENSSDQESVSGESVELDEHHDDNDEDLLSEDEDMAQLEDEDEDEEMEELEGEQDDEEEEEEEEKIVEEKSAKRPKKISEVDDDFFNLKEFNDWTEKQEELDMQSDREEDEDDEDAIDFDNDLDALEDDDDEEGDDEDVGDITYKDFFEAPEKPRRTKAGEHKVKFATEDFEEELKDDEEDEEEDDDDDEEEEEEDQKSAVKIKNLFDADEEEGSGDEKTAYQKRMSAVQAQIDQFEQENIGERHWTLKGESSAKARPVNSLLEEDMEFDHSVKPVPVITQESTTALEDLIKKRIVDNMFDDVERKSDPSARPFLPSKRVELNDQRSKKSLAELYEDDYVKKTTNDQTNEKDEALNKEHEEISTMFQTLCEKLDALSNFHYTPKAPKPEITVVSNAAAISMEDVTPVNVSDATLFAPEEVYDKKRNVIKSSTEMEQDERRRARAMKKKLAKKEKDIKERELKLIQKNNPNVGSRQAKTKAVKELLGQKNVTVINKDGKKISTKDKPISSASLF
ncbi:U3 small nucleolar ribonucleoprotein complex, subunit Mpp10 [Phycomyces blakesleeanus]